MPINTSRLQREMPSEYRTMTIAVFIRSEGSAPVLADSYTFRYATMSLDVGDLGMFKVEPTAQGIHADVRGYWATKISLKGHTGHAAKFYGGKMVDGESMLQSLREILRDAFGANRYENSPIIIINGRSCLQSEVEVHFYNWLGESSYELANQEFYRVFPDGQEIFHYRRQPGRQLWDFTLNFIGVRIDQATADQTMTAIADKDPISEAFLFPTQFTNIWQYLTSIKLGEGQVGSSVAGGRQAFTWFDAVNHYIAEPYYRQAARLSEIRDAIDSAYIQGQAWINLPFLTMQSYSQFLLDCQEDVGIVPSEYTAPVDLGASEKQQGADTDRRGKVNYSLLKQSRESIAEMARLISYPDRFVEQTGQPYYYRKHLVVENEMLHDIARKYKTSWADIVARNKLDYPYLVTPGTEIIVPIPDTSTVVDNTIRSNLTADGITVLSDEDRAYGRDILVNSEGEWQLSAATQDVQIARGIQCLAQSIEDMQGTYPGEYADYPTRGNPILPHIGERMHASEVEILTIQLQKAIASDSRIDSVPSCRLDYSGGVIRFIDTVFIPKNKVKSEQTRVAVK